MSAVAPMRGFMVYCMQRIKEGRGSMDWVKKRAEIVVLIGALFSGFLWMNGKFNDMERRFSEIENRLTRIETIIYVKGLISQELAANEGK